MEPRSVGSCPSQTCFVRVRFMDRDAFVFAKTEPCPRCNIDEHSIAYNCPGSYKVTYFVLVFPKRASDQRRLARAEPLIHTHVLTHPKAKRKSPARRTYTRHLAPLAHTHHAAMFGILEAVAVPHSGIYASCEELMRDLNTRAEKEGYKIVKARSHRSRPGAPIVRADLVCERGGGPYRCQATKHKTSTKKTNCPWKAKAVDRKLVGGWVLTLICDHHNHEPGTPEPPTPSEGSQAGDIEELVEEVGKSLSRSLPPGSASC